MAKYIECDCCGKRIEFGAEVYQYEGRAGLYCSTECFFDTYGNIYTLTDELAYYCCCTVFDDETRQREILEQIEKHKLEIESLQRTLKLITPTTQN